jgi:hypothetical protein
MLAEDTVRTLRSIPPANPDSPTMPVPTVGNRYAEQRVAIYEPTMRALADEGQIFTATMAPGATALQLGISASFSATAACIAFGNLDSIAGLSNKRCWLHFIEFYVTTAPTSGTSLLFATVVDNVSRLPTTVAAVGSPATQTAYKVPVNNVNMDSGAQPVGQPYFPISTAAGAPPIVPAAGGASRTIVGNGNLRGQIPVAQDVYTILFGAPDNPSGQLVTAAPAGASRVVYAHPPVIIGPQQWFLLHMWAPSNVTAGIAFLGLTMQWAER